MGCGSSSNLPVNGAEEDAAAQLGKDTDHGAHDAQYAARMKKDQQQWETQNKFIADMKDTEKREAYEDEHEDWAARYVRCAPHVKALLREDEDDIFRESEETADVDEVLLHTVCSPTMSEQFEQAWKYLAIQTNDDEFNAETELKTLKVLHSETLVVRLLGHARRRISRHPFAWDTVEDTKDDAGFLGWDIPLRKATRLPVSKDDAFLCYQDALIHYYVGSMIKKRKGLPMPTRAEISKDPSHAHAYAGFLFWDTYLMQMSYKGWNNHEGNLHLLELAEVKYGNQDLIKNAIHMILDAIAKTTNPETVQIWHEGDRRENKWKTPGLFG